MHLQDLIPLEARMSSSRVEQNRSRLVIGHNVAFDRSFVKEQYYLEVSAVFLVFKSAVG